MNDRQNYIIRNENDKKLIKKIIDSDNEHILTFWNELNDIQKDTLLSQVEPIDFKEIDELLDKLDEKDEFDRKFDSTDYIPFEKSSHDKTIYQLGNKVYSNGKVGFILVAGGQGSRLGYDHPKGCYPISPVTSKSLFQIFAEKIQFANKFYKNDFPWYIMTSIYNHDEIVDFFSKNKYFGLNKESVIFFKQGMNPTVSHEGKLILRSKYEILQNPDGHGGTIKALSSNGLFDDIKERGVEYLSYFQVDNPLVNIIDPTFMGYHINEGSEVSSKVIAKLYPDEKLGAIGKINGKNCVIEYSDLPDSEKYATNSNGDLKYLMGSIAIHIFSVKTLSHISLKLPIHFAFKKVKGYDLSEKNSKIKELDAIKFERFIFDTIPSVKKSIFFETKREEEFSPLKNKEGKDSIETTLQGQIAQFNGWLKQADLIPHDKNIKKLEISPLYAPNLTIFLEKAKKDTDILKEYIFTKDGKLKNEVVIK